MPTTHTFGLFQRNKLMGKPKSYLLIGLLLINLSSLAQGRSKVYDALFEISIFTGVGLPDTTVFTIVEHQPEFPGGSDALKEYLLKNVQYPADAQKAGIKGRVFVSFVVEIDGSLTNSQLLKGLGYGCDEEAIRVIKAMPRWLPGSQSGRPIRVKYNLPILFGIDYPKQRVR